MRRLKVEWAWRMAVMVGVQAAACAGVDTRGTWEPRGVVFEVDRQGEAPLSIVVRRGSPKGQVVLHWAPPVGRSLAWDPLEPGRYCLETSDAARFEAAARVRGVSNPPQLPCFEVPDPPPTWQYEGRLVMGAEAVAWVEDERSFLETAWATFPLWAQAQDLPRPSPRVLEGEDALAWDRAHPADQCMAPAWQDDLAGPHGSSASEGHQAGHGTQQPASTQRASLSKQEISLVIQARLSSFKRCYEAELDRNAEAQGKCAVYFVIGANGQVTTARPSGCEEFSEVMRACMRHLACDLDFPRPRGQGIVIVTYPFVFWSE